MRLLILIFSLWALAYAKPEIYKEKEDFQYSRSSSDEGSKSGYYGAQRGNMGGNYERAHNMDLLAQHQMSTLVRQVDGELGEGANTRTGSVFTSGNSRGIYGSGNYDLSNLKGRSFGEGSSYGDSQSQSSFLSQNAGYSGNSYSAANNARYSASQLRALGLASQYGQVADQQAGGLYSGASNYEYGSQGANNYRYYTHSGSQERSAYDQSNANLHSESNTDDSSQSKLITTPVRIYLRPGTRIAIPVSAQTYDASQNVLVRDQNTVNTEAELLSNSGKQINVIKPVSNAKHYESRYSYRKEWEKHDTQPITVIPTENPFPQNSELYEDSQLSQTVGKQFKSEVDSAQSSNMNSAYASKVNSGYNSAYNANTKSATANRLQYQSQLQNYGSNLASNAYTFDTHNSGASTKLNSLVEDINSRPKSYQSSYSYHKSWERHGDPYVIKPVGGDLNALTSQRLVVPPIDQNLYYGNQYGQATCDLQCHLRKRRSYHIEQYHPQMYQENLNPQSINVWLSDLGQQSNDHQNFEYLGQQPQNKRNKLENLGQETQNQWSNLDLGQQTQNKWDNLESLNQQSESGVDNLSQMSQSQLDNLEDLGQQTLDTWKNLDTLNQKPQSDIENLGQETQNTWNNLESLNQHPQDGMAEVVQQSQSQLDNLEDLGQQTQNIWNNLETLNQKPQSDIENLGQETQNTWNNLESLNQKPQRKFEEVGQQSQSQLDQLEDLGQQTQNIWNNLETLNQKPQSDIENLGQEAQNTWNNLETLNQKPQSKIEEVGQQSQSQLDQLEDLGQQTQNIWNNLETLNQKPQSDIENLGQEAQNTWNNLETLNQKPQSKIEEVDQQSQSQLDQLEDLGQQTQNIWNNLETLNQKPQSDIENLGQEAQNTWNNLETLNQKPQSKIEEVGQQNQSQLDQLEDLGQQTQNMWTNLETLNQQPHSIIEEVGQQSQIQLNSLDDSGQQTQKIWKNLDSLNQHPQNGIEEMGQQSQSKRDNLEDLGQQTQDTWKNLETLNQKPQSEIENLGQETQNTWNNLEKNLTPQLESELNQQNLNNWNRIEEQQSRNQEEQMQPEFNVWDKINNFESQHNMESHTGNTNHQQFYSSHKKNVDTWDQTFQHYNLSQRTNESKPTTSNTEKNLWDIINKAISEYDKETDNINHKQYISNQEWEEKYSAHNNYYHNSHYFHQQHNFGETKETLTEKTITQSKETNKYLGFEVIDHSITSSTTEKVKSTEKPKIIIPIPENNSPVEIGRGDIGADEIPPLILEVNDKSNSKKVEDDNTLNSDKLYKTQDEIESLSLTHFNGNQYNDKLNQEAADLSVMGLEQHVESINTPTRKPKDNHYNNQNNFLSDQTLPKQYRVPSYNKPLTVERNPTYEDLQKSEVQIPDNFQQQNFNPIWVDLEQQMSNKQDIIDLGQQKQEPININIQQEHYLHQQQNFDKNLQNKQEKIQRQDFHDYYNKHSLNEEQFHDVNNLKSVPKKDEIVEQPIESSEEPGFWKSVWKKTVSAKDKVVSWFKN